MANLIIKKSDTENISIPLTTEKPIARSLAVFKDGKIYYNPLVHSGEYLDSGVKVRIGNTDYALSTEIYDPICYNSKGDLWDCYGNPHLYSRGTLLFDGVTYLQHTSDIALSNSIDFQLRCYIVPTRLGSDNTIFSGIIPGTSKRFNLYLNSSKKLVLSLNDTAIATLSTVFANNCSYSIVLEYASGKFDVCLDGVWLSSPISKTITTGDYTMRIGANHEAGNNFVGLMKNVRFTYNSTLSINARLFRFGN